MKKFAYIAGGIIIGIVFSTTAVAFADQVKSLVGKKVTGEYTIVVDGKKLSDKGAVIDSKVNVPARALSEALGADVSVSGKTITITSEGGVSNVEGSGNTTSTSSASSNKYIGGTKASLEELRDSTQNKILAPLLSEREKVAKDLEEIKSGGNADLIASFEKKLAEYDAEIARYQKQLEQINEALSEIK